MKPAVNVIAAELSKMILLETKAYFTNDIHKAFEPGTLKQNIEDTVRLYFTDYNLMVMRADTLADLEAKIRQSLEKKLRRELKTA